VVDQRSTTLPAKLYSNTNVPTSNRWAVHEGPQELGVSPQQLNKYLTSTWQVLDKYLTSTWQVLDKYLTSTWLVSCFHLLRLLFLDLVFHLPISLWSILFNSLSTKLPYGAYSVSHILQSSFILIISDLSLACTRYRVGSPFVRIWSCAPL